MLLCVGVGTGMYTCMETETKTHAQLTYPLSPPRNFVHSVTILIKCIISIEIQLKNVKTTQKCRFLLSVVCSKRNSNAKTSKTSQFPTLLLWSGHLNEILSIFVQIPLIRLQFPFICVRILLIWLKSC